MGNQSRGRARGPRKDDRPLWKRTIIFVSWLLCTPFIFCYHALRVYIWGFFRVYLGRFFTTLSCGLCMMWGYSFKDDFFGDKAISGSATQGDGDHGAYSKGSGKVQWLRLKDVCTNMGYLKGKETPLLFDTRIEPADILQGGLGDCWLMAGMASVAMYPHLIRQIFQQREYNPVGKYKLRLYDKETLKPVTVVIDDRIPCRPDGRPLFARPNGKEAWVLLLEKAFAKLWGSYEALDGGTVGWAVQTMLGCPMIYYVRKGAKWVRIMVKGPIDEAQKKIGKAEESADMFKMLSVFIKLGSLVSAAMHDAESGMEAVSRQGLVNRHAYSLLATVKAKSSDGKWYRLVKLRNPWGSGEWKGDWSDHSPLWKQHAGVAKAANQTAAEDGAFWIAWEDFSCEFDGITIMARDIGARNLLLEYDESRPWCGPAVGCSKGLLSYCFCCLGCRTVCCGVDADYVAETDVSDTKCLSSRWWQNLFIPAT